MSVPWIVIKTLLWLQLGMGLVCCMVAYMACRFVRGLVLVIDGSRVWTDGMWHPIRELSHVTLALLPREFADLPLVVLRTASGRDLSPGLWRFRQSGAEGAGQRLAHTLGIPFESY